MVGPYCYVKRSQKISVIVKPIEIADLFFKWRSGSWSQFLGKIEIEIAISILAIGLMPWKRVDNEIKCEGQRLTDGFRFLADLFVVPLFIGRSSGGTLIKMLKKLNSWFNVKRISYFRPYISHKLKRHSLLACFNLLMR